MKPIKIREGYNSDGFKNLGGLVIEFDKRETYDEDQTKLFKNGAKYTLIYANRCSCWAGYWEGFTDVSKTELRELGESWSKDWGEAEQAIGNWIKNNI